MALDSIVHFDMIYLDCDELKHELSTLSTSLGQSVHENLAATHRSENVRYILVEFNLNVIVKVCCKQGCICG